MSKVFSLLAATLAVWSFCGDAVARDRGGSNARAASNAGAAAGAVAGAEAVGAIFMPGALGGVPGGAAGAAAAAASAGGWNQPQLIMNSTNAPSTGTFNDCGVAWSGAVWLVSASSTSESSDCVRQRLAQLYLANGNPQLASELLCGIKFVDEADRSTHQNRCPNQRAAQAKAAANGAPVPRVQAPTPIAAVSRRGEFPRGEAGMIQCLNTYGVAACQ